MGAPQALTSQDGFYRFPTLAPGEYTLQFAREGFGTVRREGILVGVGFTATVNVDLTVAAQEQTVVHGSPVLDRHATAIATSFDARQLDNLPASRSMVAILSSTPAVHVGRFEVGGNNGGFGSAYSAYGTSGQNRPLVEGITVSGIAGTGFALNYGSFEEVLVGTAAHSAEWPLPGVQMQFISKSGGDQYRGTFYADYERNSWQAFNIDEEQILRGARGASGLTPREANRLWSYYDVNADVGGYIKRDTLWWYSSFRDQDVSARQVNLPVTPYRTRLTNYSGKGTYQPTRNHRFVVYGQVGRNHLPTRLDPFGPRAASTHRQSSTSRWTRPPTISRGAGCGRANGTRSCATTCCSSFAPDNSAPTGRRRRMAPRIDSKTSPRSSSGAAIATVKRVAPRPDNRFAQLLQRRLVREPHRKSRRRYA